MQVNCQIHATVALLWREKSSVTSAWDIEWVWVLVWVLVCVLVWTVWVLVWTVWRLQEYLQMLR